jgi:cell fate (sporulation/competence/biofilm development) regulator YlbF (YheA/YmcA/DUF963 family)
MLTSDLEHAAQRLAMMLSGSDPVERYREARRRLDADPAARALLDRFEARRAELRGRASGGVQPTDEEIDDLFRLQSAAQNHPLVRAFLKAEARGKRYLQEINQDLSRHLGLDFSLLGATHAGDEG